MISLKQEFDQLEVGGPAHFRNLTLFPLFRPGWHGEPNYILLEDATRQGVATVTELDSGGSVPELRFENRADHHVLLLDGEELLGAKQNRVVNLTILAPARQKLVIPVSCVEAGRWYMETPECRPAPHIMYSRARAARAADVTESMRASGSHRSDQSALWDEIALKSARVGAESPTRAMSALYERLALQLEEFHRAFAWQEQQAGVVFALCGQILGMDLLDAPATMRRVFPKLVRSYAMDAVDAPQPGSPAVREQVSAFLSGIALAPSFAQSAVGLGKDVRFNADSTCGAALWAEDRYVHVCGFAGPSNGRSRRLQTRISRPAQRRSN